MSERQTKAGNLKKLLAHWIAYTLSHSVTQDMLNNFCFHVYAQKQVPLLRFAMTGTPKL